MEKEKSFTIIYADILIFANCCKCCLKWKKRNNLQQFMKIFQFLPIFAYNGKSWVPLGNIGKNEALHRVAYGPIKYFRHVGSP